MHPFRCTRIWTKRNPGTCANCHTAMAIASDIWDSYVNYVSVSRYKQNIIKERLQSPSQVILYSAQRCLNLILVDEEVERTYGAFKLPKKQEQYFPRLVMKNRNIYKLLETEI
ncbi:hypothetical protein RND81_09G240200 [Saponaria officinalis]|uniref:Uncharacterized protein n=1 Tax=Saponaria officinalis TaxID=3572 RepID=A0AAW1IPV6_SAPOF